MHQTKILSYGERATKSKNPIAKKLFQLMQKKQTNLAANFDVTSSEDLLRLANLAGPYLCVLKTHVDILKDFSPSFPQKLKDLAHKHDFLIFEDRKFADIGAVVKQQYTEGLYRIASWADIVNAHPIPGPGIIQGLKEAGHPLGRGLLLVAEMSSAGSLASGTYTDATVAMAQEHADFVIGFITQQKLCNDPGFLHFTPGVQLAEGSDSLGQRYRTPEKAIRDSGCDIIIVGRGILQASDPAKEAARYRDAGMHALR